MATGGAYQGHSGWIYTVNDVVEIVKDPDSQKLSTPDSVEVCDIPKDFQPIVLIFSSDIRCPH